MDKRVKKNIIKYSILKNVFTAFITLLLLGIAWALWGDNLNLSQNAVIIGIAIIAIITIYSCFITPFIHVKIWSYKIDKQAVTYTNGLFSVKKTVIPMGKIQNISTVTNPVLRKFGLIEVSIQTFTDSHSLNRIAIEESTEMITSIKTILKDTYFKDLNKPRKAEDEDDRKE